MLMPLRSVAMTLCMALVCSCVADRPFQNGAASTAAAPVDAIDSGAYVLAHVEFDDQGWFHDTGQRKALFDKLGALNADGKAMLIVTYAHGWKHNAAELDDNLVDFRKLLEQLAILERTYRPAKPRTVVGVYIGWRGATVAVPVVENLTFWTRKNAAERVGSRSVKQLFVELNQFRAVANKWKSSDQLANSSQTQLIFVGHSFGGLITYQALYSFILERGLQVDEKGRYRIAKSFGDFVLLVNPAFEGAAYEPIWQAARSRRCFPLSQKPVMAIVTSSADWATRLTFPAGRLYTYLQSAPQPGERQTVLHTVGHLDRYRTHRIEVAEGAAVPPAVPGVTPGEVASAAQPNAQGTTVMDGFRLVQVDTDAPERMPYLVMRAGRELIADHNDFWNDRFRSFTVQFISRQILAPTPPADEAGDGCQAFCAVGSRHNGDGSLPCVPSQVPR